MNGNNNRNDFTNEKIEIIVNKDNRFGDFGFSIIDNTYGGRGIFVDKVRNLAQNPYLKQYSQIFKVKLKILKNRSMHQ